MSPSPLKGAALALVVAALTAVALVPVSQADPDARGGVDRVMADVDAEVWAPTFPGGFPLRFLGFAHIQVHAYDIDLTPIVNQFAQTADEGWVSCDPVGSQQCSLTRGGGVRSTFLSVTFENDTTALILVDGRLSMLLRDGGTPGNAIVPSNVGSGWYDTLDWIAMGAFGANYQVLTHVVSGNVTIHRY